MVHVRRWNAESELRYLWSRSLDLDSYLQELQRRKRAGCPSPEPFMASVRPTVTMEQPGPAPTSFQPINMPTLHASTESLVEQSERLHTSHDAHFPTAQLNPDHEDEQPNLEDLLGQVLQEEDSHRETKSIPDTDWSVVKIKDKRRGVAGLVEHLVEWGKSEHPSSVIQQSDDGQWRVSVDGREWEVTERGPTRTDAASGDVVELLTWKRTWLPDWELPKESISDFEIALGEVKSAKLETEEPSWWKYSEYGDFYLPPEAEPRPGTKRSMTFDYLLPAAGADYTISFLELMKGELFVEGELPKLPKKTIIRFLNLRIRQRLQFPAAIVQKGQVHSLERPERIRALLVYIFGRARVAQCTWCREQGGPFAKCVTWRGEFYGACANCAFNRRNPSCEYHLDHAHDEVPKLAPHAVARDEEREPSSSPYLIDEVGIAARSSVELGGPDMPPTPESSQDGSEILPPLWALRRTHDVKNDGDAAVSGRTQPADNEEIGEPGGGLDSEDNYHLQPKRHNEVDAATDDGAASQSEERTFKRQRLDSHDSTPPLYDHLYCSGSRNQPCTDPIAGFTYEGKTPLVMSDRRFTACQATDEEVRYILSRCECGTTGYLQDLWVELQRMKAEAGEALGWRSKEQFISAHQWTKLNQVVPWVCPWPYDKDEVVDLTEDD